ncbi:ABC transporter permease [Elioraea sp.]|uniref:ABC transporter permease n=1 Tax=Elioraea sp. TaxID=2185103 RepID=UPI0025BB2145|nr:ABC transporter permease subunit [Elioraea sp.]
MNDAPPWRGPLLLVIGVTAVWQVLYLLVGEIALRSPAETVASLAGLLADPRFWPHLRETTLAFGFALLLAAASGLLIGITLGVNRFARDVAEPMLVAIYSIPKVTLYPILLLAFGLGISAKVAFGAIHGFIPIALFTMNAVRTIRPVLIKTGRIMKLSPPALMWRILLPAALPEIFTGLRIGFSLTLIGTLLGEMFASQRGLGFMLMNAIGLHHVDIIMSITLLVTVFAVTVSLLLIHLDRKLPR